jgi:hypothetical protein
MDKPILDNLKFFSVIGIVIATILVVGWRQPLSYRFMSKAEIDAIENPPRASPTPWIYDKARSTDLDRPPYNRNTGNSRSYYAR